MAGLASLRDLIPTPDMDDEFADLDTLAAQIAATDFSPKKTPAAAAMPPKDKHRSRHATQTPTESPSKPPGTGNESPGKHHKSSRKDKHKSKTGTAAADAPAAPEDEMFVTAPEVPQPTGRTWQTLLATS